MSHSFTPELPYRLRFAEDLAATTHRTILSVLDSQGFSEEVRVEAINRSEVFYNREISGKSLKVALDTPLLGADSAVFTSCQPFDNISIPTGDNRGVLTRGLCLDLFSDGSPRVEEQELGYIESLQPQDGNPNSYIVMAGEDLPPTIISYQLLEGSICTDAFNKARRLYGNDVAHLLSDEQCEATISAMEQAAPHAHILVDN